MPEREHGPMIGVRLPPPSDPGAWLADAAAFETAGAHGLWIGLPGDGDGERGWDDFDLYALTAALAAVTYRVLLVLDPADHSDPADHGNSRVLTTIEKLSGGRVALITGATKTEVFLDHQLGGGRWVPVPYPDGRAAWRQTLTGAVEQGADGVLVPAGASLLDILRNPQDPGGRRDLHLAQG